MYDYNKNLNISVTPNGDVVLTMNDAVFTEIVNHLHDAATMQANKGLNATSVKTMELWRALNDKYDHETEERNETTK